MNLTIKIWNWNGLYEKEEKRLLIQILFSTNWKIQLVFAEDAKVALNEFNNDKMDAAFGNESDQFYNPDDTSESV